MRTFIMTLLAIDTLIVGAAGAAYGRYLAIGHDAFVALPIW